MSTPITSYVKAALVNLLTDETEGFNATIAPLCAEYGIDLFAMNWDPEGGQYFPFWSAPDQMDDSTPSVYPMVFVYGRSSFNTHRSMNRVFSGTVEIGLDFWVSSPGSTLLQAGLTLETTITAIEEASNDLFYDANWPQSWGAYKCVCMPPAFNRGPIQPNGQEWRQYSRQALRFTLDNT